jgi:hypothetical protein
MTMPGIITGTIGAADVMREFAGLRTELAALRVDVGAGNIRLAVIDITTKGTAEQAADHERRIRVLEDFRGKLLGVAITAGLGSGAVSAIIGYVLGHLGHLYNSGLPPVHRVITWGP